MKTKLFEIRDRGTFMPAMATRATSNDEQEKYLLASSGFAFNSSFVILHFLELDKASYDPYGWGGRTMTTAHRYIQENWEKLKSGDVIDVEYVLGETSEPKMSQRQEEIGGYCLDTF